MGKKSRTAKPRPVGEVGPRQPCPCGSGRRYKACHGSADGQAPYVVRTFEGLVGECDWVALREFVPAATAPIKVRPGVLDDISGDARACTVLPGIAPGLRSAAGEVRIALQVAHQSTDPSRDFTEALRLAFGCEPSTSVTIDRLPAAGPRLQDVLDPDVAFDVTVHEGYDFWFDADEPDAATRATLDDLNSSINPTARLNGVDAAYWTSVTTKEHLRWVMPHDEEDLLTALARLHAAGADRIDDRSRLVGSFRAHGLLVPVWDLPVGTGADAIESGAEEFAERLGNALADSASLTSEERSARHGLANRQITIR